MRVPTVLALLMTCGLAIALDCEEYVEDGDLFESEFLEFDEEYDDEWLHIEEILHEEKKSKDDRKSIFKNAIKEINKENREHKDSDFDWCAGPNLFAGMDEVERKSFFGRADSSKFNDTSSKRAAPLSITKRSLITKRSVDHRAKTGPIEYQPCGNCWSYAASHAAVFLKNKNGGNFDGSEQEISTCTYGLVNPSNNGCNGGFGKDGWDFLKTYTFLAEDQYPTYDQSKQCDKTKLTKSPFIVGWKWVEGHHFSKENTGVDQGRINALKQTLNDRPVAVAMHATPEFQSYKNGIYQQSGCQKTTNHEMLMVGYGDGYWIIKNSWGTGWGEQGYARVVMGKNMCNCEASCYYPLAATDDSGGGETTAAPTTAAPTTAAPQTTTTEYYYQSGGTDDW